MSAAQPTVSYSTYFGGANVDAATAVATDTNGNIYVAGWTESADLAPTVAPQLRGSGVDAFVLKSMRQVRLCFSLSLAAAAKIRPSVLL